MLALATPHSPCTHYRSKSFITFPCFWVFHPKLDSRRNVGIPAFPLPLMPPAHAAGRPGGVRGPSLFAARKPCVGGGGGGSGHDLAACTVMAGYLQKKTRSIFSGWQLRYFVLSSEQGGRSATMKYWDTDAQYVSRPDSAKGEVSMPVHSFDSLAQVRSPALCACVHL